MLINTKPVEIELSSDDDTEKMPPPALPVAKAVKKTRTKKKQSAASTSSSSVSSPPSSQSSAPGQLRITRSKIKKEPEEKQSEPVPVVVPIPAARAITNTTAAEITTTTVDESSIANMTTDHQPKKKGRKKKAPVPFVIKVEKLSIGEAETQAATEAQPIVEAPIPAPRAQSSQNPPSPAHSTQTEYEDALPTFVSPEASNPIVSPAVEENFNSTYNVDVNKNNDTFNVPATNSADVTRVINETVVLEQNNIRASIMTEDNDEDDLPLTSFKPPPPPKVTAKLNPQLSLKFPGLPKKNEVFK